MIGSLVGSYKITDKIGEGGMGAVFRGIDVMLEREVAIKMLRPELSRQPNIVERFRSEAVTLAKLNHPNIATLYSFLRQGDDFFMVMEFVRGETLDSVIRNSGAMACERAIVLLCQALEGIDHAHRMGIIHRDIKPANIMLTESGTLKVMDFGIARVLGTARMTKQGNIVGTIEYMSPEQVRGQETDARSDIYSLGILLYEMLTGRVPFQSDSEYDLMKMQIEDAPSPPRVFAAHIPQLIEQAIMRSLAKRPEARFQSAAEFRNMLLSATGAAVAPSIVAPVAPVRVTDPVIAAGPTAATEPRETRLVAGASAPVAGDQMKQTRLAGEETSPVAYPAPAGFQPAAQVTPAKSNAKLFIGLAAAAVVIIALVGVVIVMLSGGKKPAATSTPSVTQPIQTTTPAPPPASVSQPAMVVPQPPPQPVPQMEPVKPAEPVAGGESSSANKSAGKVTKTARKETDAEAAARKEKERKAAEARRLLNQ
jgi:serine/threonine-protein kinase